MGSCQNDGPFLGTLNIRCRIIIRTQKGTIILTTIHIYIYTTIMELGPRRPSPLWLLGSNSIIVVCMDPLGDRGALSRAH